MDLPSNYSELDPAFYTWADKRGLHIYTCNREWETRSVLIVDDFGDTYTLGIAPPVSPEQVTVHAGSFSLKGRYAIPKAQKKHYSVTVPVQELESALEEAYQRIRAWIAEADHKRTQ